MLCSRTGDSACLLSPWERGRHRCGVVPKPRSPTGSPAAQEHLDCLATSIPLALTLEGGTNGCWAPKTRVPPPPQCFSAHPHIPGPGKESAARGAGRCCLGGGRAPGASDSRSHPVPLHASPSRNIPKSCRPFSSKPGGLADTGPYSHSPGSGFPISWPAWPPSPPAWHIDSSPLTLIKACKADLNARLSPLPTLCMPSRSPNATRLLAMHSPWHSICCHVSLRPREAPKHLPRSHQPWSLQSTALGCGHGGSTSSEPRRGSRHPQEWDPPQFESGHVGSTGAEPLPALHLPAGQPHHCLRGKQEENLFSSAPGEVSALRRAAGKMSHAAQRDACRAAEPAAVPVPWVPCPIICPPPPTSRSCCHRC